jgi:hypothetical protein
MLSWNNWNIDEFRDIRFLCMTKGREFARFPLSEEVLCCLNDMTLLQWACNYLRHHFITNNIIAGDL